MLADSMNSSPNGAITKISKDLINLYLLLCLFEVLNHLIYCELIQVENMEKKRT